MMAFVGAGRDSAARTLLEAQRSTLDLPGDNAGFLLEVGLSATEAIHAFGQEDYLRSVNLLRPIRSHAHRFGGSHAQRDLLDLTLIEAARRSGHSKLAAALLAERAAAKAGSPLGVRMNAATRQRRVMSEAA